MTDLVAAGEFETHTTQQEDWQEHNQCLGECRAALFANLCRAKKPKKLVFLHLIGSAKKDVSKKS
jgi:hypothetical protein